MSEELARRAVIIGIEQIVEPLSDDELVTIYMAATANQPITPDFLGYEKIKLLLTEAAGTRMHAETLRVLDVIVERRMAKAARRKYDIDYSQYHCQECGKLGICEDGMDVFIAALCQECYDRLLAEYIKVISAGGEHGQTH